MAHPVEGEEEGLYFYKDHGSIFHFNKMYREIARNETDFGNIIGFVYRKLNCVTAVIIISRILAIDGFIEKIVIVFVEEFSVFRHAFSIAITVYIIIYLL